MSKQLTWREMWEALEALGDVTLNRNVYGEFYLNVYGVEVKEHEGDGVLGDSTGQHSPSLEGAIVNTWDRCVTNLPKDGYLVLNAHDPVEPRQHFRWNGFMWEQLKVKEPAR